MSHVIYLEDIPRECIEDCSRPGPADAAAARWRETLNVTVPRVDAIRCLTGYGAWERDELEASTDNELAERILWLACGDFSEYQHEVAAGRAKDPRAGSDIFVLE
jgi:hypothetical protein